MGLKNVFICAAAITLSISWTAQASNALFCQHCTSDTLAKQEAANHAPRLYCQSPNPDEFMTPDNQYCYSTQKRVILVNPDTKSIYAYSVGHVQAAPWNTTVTPVSITSAQRTGYLKIVDFYKDYKNAVADAEYVLNANARLQWKGRTVVSTASSSSECPVNTALDYFTDPSKMTALRDTIALQIATGLKGNINDYFQSGAQVNNIGVSLLGSGFSIGWNSSTKKPVFIKSFTHSELPSSFDDTLIFDMELNGFSANGLPQIGFKVNDTSRVAGYQISDLKGNFGALPITNNCVLEKLQRLTADGDFLNKDGKPVNIGGGFDNTPAPGTGGGGGGSGQTCTVYFYQSGQLLYVFRTMC